MDLYADAYTAQLTHKAVISTVLPLGGVLLLVMDFSKMNKF